MTFDLPPHFSFSLKTCNFIFLCDTQSCYITKRETKKPQKFSVLLVRGAGGVCVCGENQRSLLLAVSPRINWIIKRIINPSTSKTEAKVQVKIM